jgi:thioredoxin reductase (NADPH)
MHDVIIIGAGPAGLSAAFWCDELGLDTLVIEQKAEVGGQLHSIHHPIDNYLGVRARNGSELCDLFSTNIEDADFDLWTDAEIESVDLRAKSLALRSGEKLNSIALIIATGVRRRRLGIPGEIELTGKGIVESGTRDRDLLAGKDICIVGGGDTAAENALMLAEVCPTVTVVQRGRTSRARKEFSERLHTNHCITVFKESNVQRIIGRDWVEAVEILRNGALQPFQMAVGGVLIRIGVEPNTKLFSDQLHVDGNGYVVVNGEQETSVGYVFAIGDVSNPMAPTIAGATGAGATAAKIIASRLRS